MSRDGVMLERVTSHADNSLAREVPGEVNITMAFSRTGKSAEETKSRHGTAQQRVYRTSLARYQRKERRTQFCPTEAQGIPIAGSPIGRPRG
jgi:hypothetical protein